MHWAHLIVSATLHLQHLCLHQDTRSFGHLTGLDDILDLLPSLRSLQLSAEADDCTDQVELFIPLPSILARHPLLHAIRIDSSHRVDLSIANVVAMASHPALSHIVLRGDLHIWEDEGSVDLRCFNSDRLGVDEDAEDGEWDDEAQEFRLPRICRGCPATVGWTARTSLLPYVREQVTEEWEWERLEEYAALHSTPSGNGEEMRAIKRQRLDALMSELHMEEEAVKRRRVDHESVSRSASSCSRQP